VSNYRAKSFSWALWDFWHPNQCGLFEVLNFWFIGFRRTALRENWWKWNSISRIAAFRIRLSSHNSSKCHHSTTSPHFILLLCSRFSEPRDFFNYRNDKKAKRTQWQKPSSFPSVQIISAGKICSVHFI
jgi:hypothetical protein